MKNLMKTISILTVLMISIVGCVNDDDVDTPDAPDTDRGTIEANRLQITFFPLNDTTNKSVYEFSDQDGTGGVAPTVNETIMLNYPQGGGNFFSYKARIRIFNGTNDVTADIFNQQTKYIICYRDMDNRNLRVTSRTTDTNNKPLGIEAEFTTVDEGGSSNPSNGGGDFKITLNYQKEGKDGSCDAGIRILEANMNYQLN